MKTAAQDYAGKLQGIMKRAKAITAMVSKLVMVFTYAGEFQIGKMQSTIGKNDSFL